MTRIKLAEAKDEYEKTRDEMSDNVKPRVHAIAETFAVLLEPKEETHKETCSRLFHAIGKKIHPKVFYEAVKLVREKKNGNRKSEEVTVQIMREGIDRRKEQQG